MASVGGSGFAQGAGKHPEAALLSKHICTVSKPASTSDGTEGRSEVVSSCAMVAATKARGRNLSEKLADTCGVLGAVVRKSRCISSQKHALNKSALFSPDRAYTQRSWSSLAIQVSS